MIRYRIIRSQRKSLAIEIREAEILVRAPMQTSDAAVQRFVEAHRAWIEKQLRISRERLAVADAQNPLTAEDIRALAERAKRVLPERVAHFASLLGVTYGRITIRNQRSKWGSCSAKGNLNFNCLLMLAPPQVQDAVVVHELCHRKEMNHSSAFWREVLRVYPEYHEWNSWLHRNGSILMRRMKNGAQTAHKPS